MKRSTNLMNATTRHTVIASSIGDITIVAGGDAIVGVYFPGHWTRPNTRMFGARVADSSDPLLTVAERQLTEYLDNKRVGFDLPTNPAGDDFQIRVWALLAEIPYGETVTYGDLAERIGDRRLAQDVGQAVGSNPLSMIVPCHRVVGKDGKLTGYAGGLERKRKLLELEGAIQREPVVTNLLLWAD
jgi:methylated-DNA-[protein]-cysteine S-methyltransferase